mgnify:CR=1 FL=1
MASPTIKIKRSSVAGKVPHYPTSLDLGEFAINTADGKVFIAAGVGIGTTVREVGISTQHLLTSGIGTLGSLKVTGGMLDHLNFPDNVQAQFGTTDDLLIYHDGNSNILDNGSGDLIVTSNGGKIDFQKLGGEKLARFYTDGQVELYHNNGKRFETTGVGATVLGTFHSQEVHVTGLSTFRHGVHSNIYSTGISTISGFQFPSTDGTEDQALVTDGNGSLSFKTLSGGGGGGATGAATSISSSSTIATEGQTAFTAPHVFDNGVQATAFPVQVFLNGLKQRVGASNDYQLSAPSTINFNSGVGIHDNVQIVVYFGHTFEEELFTSTQNQNTFSLSSSLASAKNYRVFLNGVRLRRGIDYNATTAVVLTQGCTAGDEVDIVSDQAEDHLTAVEGQTAFAPTTSTTTSSNMEVYLNGVLLNKTVDWTIGNPAVTIVEPATGCIAGDELDVVIRRS